MINYNVIPKSWQPLKLGEVCKVRNGYAFKSADFRDNGVLLFRQTNLDGENVKLKNAVYLPEEYLEMFKDYVIVKGDVLVGMSGSIGKMCVYNLDKPALQNQRTGLLRFASVVENKFIRYYFEVLEQEFIKKSKGVAVLNISAKDIQESNLHLPPLPEQNRIVAKIEELFSSLDKGIESLKTAQQQLKVYRQAVLKWAFEGRLTNENVVDGQLPAGWKYLKLREITKEKDGLRRGPFGSAIKKGFFVPSGYKIYEQGNAINDDPYRGNYFIDEKKYLELVTFKVIPGDLIVSCSGVTLGRISEIPNDAKPGIINQALLRIRLKHALISNNYFVLYFRGAFFQKKIFDQSQGTAMPNLVGIKDFKEIELLMPPLHEQHHIVAEIESRLSVCNKIEQSIEQSLKQSEALRQSILKKAFEGKLVPQDPNDEPASVLLARIKAEREKDKSASPPRRQAGKTKTKRTKS